MSLQKVGARKQTVIAVFPETTAGNKAFSILEAAAADLKSTVVERIPFERLDFGATDVLDKFYSANVVVVDVTERSYQATMFYQLGLRESFDMKHNVLTCVDQQSAFTGRRGSVNPDALSSASAIGVSCMVGSLPVHYAGLFGVPCLEISLILQCYLYKRKDPLHCASHITYDVGIGPAGSTYFKYR